MKKLSIKQLVIGFIVGLILLNGAQALVFKSFAYDGFCREESVAQLVKEGKLTEAEIEEFYNDAYHRFCYPRNRRKGL